MPVAITLLLLRPTSFPMAETLVEGGGGRSGAPQAPPIPSALERLKAFIRSITSSLNRTFGGTPSTGFTRATSICGKLAVVPLVAGIVADSCAYAAIDHAAAIAPNSHMNSRRLTRSPHQLTVILA